MKEKKKSSSKLIYALAFFLLLSGLSYLIFSGLSKNSMYFLHVSEALAKGLNKIDKARLFGQVLPNSTERLEKMSGIRFRLCDEEDNTKSVLVEYKGVLPDTFKPGAEVIVEGGIQKQDLFLAHTLMTKCPSKYEKMKD